MSTSWRVIAAALSYAVAATSAAADGTVAVRITDRLAQTIPAGITITDRDGKAIAGPFAAGQPATVPAGDWIVVPESQRSLAKPISLKDGQALSLDIDAKSFLWLTFDGGDSGPHPVLVEPKDGTAIAASLAAFDLSRTYNDELAGRLPGVTPEVAAKALGLARAEYGRKRTDDSFGATQRWLAGQRWSGRILAAVGDETDVQRLTEGPALFGEFTDLMIAARIEQRLGRIARGRVASIADGTPSGRAAGAAVLLHQAGIAHGDDRLVELLTRISDAPYQAWLAVLRSHAQGLDESFAAQADRLLKRAAEIAALPEAQRASAYNQYGSTLLPLVVRALATGNDDLLRRLATQPLGLYDVREIALLVVDPTPLARFAMSLSGGPGARINLVATMCAADIVLAPTDASRLLKNLAGVVLERGQREAVERTDLAPGVARGLPNDYADLFWVDAAVCRANNAVAAYVVEAMDGHLPLTSWIPRAWAEDEMLDNLAAMKWDDPEVEDHVNALELALEASSADHVESSLAAKGAAGNAYPLDIYRAYRSVASRANFAFPIGDEAGYLLAMRRGALAGRPYVLADKTHDGGVSGLAGVQIERLAKAMRFHVRLDQEAYFRRVGLADRRSQASEWEFSPYLDKRGHQLLGAVKLSRGGDMIPMQEIAADAGETAVFEAIGLPEDFGGVTLEIDLTFYDQTRALVFDLFDGSWLPLK